jgi:hypothetical protein
LHCRSSAPPRSSDHRGIYRKVVTVLFCDVVGSTALGESVGYKRHLATARLVTFWTGGARTVVCASVLSPDVLIHVATMATVDVRSRSLRCSLAD